MVCKIPKRIGSIFSLALSLKLTSALPTDLDALNIPKFTNCTKDELSSIYKDYDFTFEDIDQKNEIHLNDYKGKVIEFRYIFTNKQKLKMKLL